MEKIYRNRGNAEVIRLIGQASRILDIGCGAGDNARLLAALPGTREIFGLTASAREAELARPYMRQCWVADLSNGLPPAAMERSYDAIIFSHVLEHLIRPAEIVRDCATVLDPGGRCVIAVPNVLFWKQRLIFLRGHFEYEPSGLMDDTHLRFFTYRTAARSLLALAPDLELADEFAVGWLPVGPLRRLLPEGMMLLLDRFASRVAPNLFGYEVLLMASKRGTSAGNTMRELFHPLEEPRLS